MLPSTAPPAAGPDVVRTTDSSSGGLARVDEAAGTIQRLDLPDAVYQWAESAADELLWGVASGCVVYWQEPGGDFAHRELECNVHPDPDPLLIDGDALEPLPGSRPSGWPSSSWAAASAFPWRCT